MIDVLIAVAAAAQQPTATQLLDEATQALARGDRVTARRKLNEAQPLIDRGFEASKARFASHATWDDCVKSNASRVAAQPEKADALADAVLGMCLEQEAQVKLHATDAFHYNEGLDDIALRDEVERTMDRWREVQRQTALAIIVNAKSAR